MTTRVHVVNIGNWLVKVQKVNPKGVQECQDKGVTLYPGNSQNEYVYDSQALLVTEMPPEEKK